ncbi:hypothetical protein [Labrys wisconsinensis]|uniref:Uncharacterized protein n=1 Tax=Labrys wisconsinensis TaxID=425677 RepID=A0ABU0J4W2_9HYPH|nr:hypothetical protein [Labrys wisconsinensis]MDQ0468493.1 hypothetical protein [Labrys wisconsinensis]
MIVALILLPLAQAGLVPAGLSGGVMVMHVAAPAVVAGFASSYVAGLVHLP